MSSQIVERAEMIPLELVRCDPEFPNLRLPAPEEELTELAESMRLEGLKVPIIVVASPPPDPWFSLRAGFRRTTAARKLGWTRIPAIVRPHDIPLVEEYWTHVLENTRSKLTTYEVALSAKVMRDRFNVSPAEFAVRAGYSETYVGNLLRAIDRLPEEIVEVWKQKAPIPIEYYVRWSSLEHSEAVKMMLSYCGRNQRVTSGWRPPAEVKERYRPQRTTTAKGLTRMTRLRFAVEVARDLDDGSRKLCLQVIDYCSGAREDVPRVYDPRKKIRSYRDRKRDDLDESPEILEDK
jgi:ParB/RepB/Spo0J family partition protein